MNKNEIPRHPLKNRSGVNVSFDVHDWGDEETYNFQQPHRHNFYEVLVFEQGGAIHDIDFQTYTAHARSIHFVGADNVHLLVRGKESHGFSLLFSVDFLDEPVLVLLPFYNGNPTLQLSEPDFSRLTEIVVNIRNEYAGNKKFYRQIVKALLESALYLLARYIPEEDKPDVKSPSKYINLFKTLIKGHFKEHKSVEFYADRLNISVKHLIDICNKQTGKTPLKHIQDHTISEAKRMLYHTQLSVKEVAYELGFNDPSYFSKHFRSATGYSPGTYRKRS